VQSNRRAVCRPTSVLGLPNEPENLGLLALVLVRDSRRDALVNSSGELVPLEEQDRSTWRAQQIEEGLWLVERALRMGHAAPPPRPQTRSPRRL
jgi:RNA polymerase sigma-70 factor (ECF subfamily)